MPDLGAGGPLVLPDMKHVTGHTEQLVIGAGKDRNSYYRADRNAMGKFDTHENHGIYQELRRAIKHSFGRPILAYFDGRAFYGATGEPLRAISFRDADCFLIRCLRSLRLSDMPVLRRGFPRTAHRMASFGSSKPKTSTMRRGWR